MSFENLNNSDIRDGLIQNVKLSCNYVEKLYIEDNEYCSFEWKKHKDDKDNNSVYQNDFMGELNNRMVYIIEKSFLNIIEADNDLYDEINDLVDKYEKDGLLTIKKNILIT